MNKISKILRNSAYSLLVFVVLSFLIHSFYAVLDYNNGSLNFNVKRNVERNENNINGFNFTNSEIGELEIKPTLLQAFILENGFFKDGGTTTVFYLIISLLILKAIKHNVFSLEKINEGTLYKIFVLGFFLFVSIKIGGDILLNNYVLGITKGIFKHNSNVGGSSNFGFIMILIVNIIYGLIDYTRALKQENDLTI